MSAEAFGFGPASKLLAISAELKRSGVETHFAGLDVSLTFARTNADTYSSVIAIDRMDDLAGIPPREFDAVLSVMDPFAIVWAALHRLPSVYVDSLYWFWRWEDLDEKELQAQAYDVCGGGDVRDALRRLAEVPMHASQYMAHFLATAACAQRSPRSQARSKEMRWTRPVTIVDAIVDLSERTSENPQCWLVSGSGMLSSLVAVEQAVEWFRFVSDLIQCARAEIDASEPVLFVGNPDVLDVALRAKPSGRLPTNHSSVLRTLTTSVACLAPPGLTTILECAAYGAPVILLPEQHYGHVANYRAVEACGGGDVFPHALLHTVMRPDEVGDVLAETRAVYVDLKTRHEQRGMEWDGLVSAVAAGMDAACRDRFGLHAKQDAVVRAFAGGYDGVQQVVDVLKTTVGS